MRKIIILLSFLTVVHVLFLEDLYSMSLNEYKEKVRKIQNLSDDKNSHKQAIEQFKSLRNSSLDFADRKKYLNGLEISIFLLANKINDYHLMNDQLQNILREGNQEFIAIEKYSTKQPGVVFEFWLYGYTIPHLVILYVYKNQFGKSSPDTKFNELKSLLTRYNKLSYGRLAGSSSDTTYGDECIHLMYFDNSISPKQKYKYLYELLQVAEGGSSEGNAHLSMALLSKELNDKEQMKEHAGKCIKILESHLDEHLYNETMQNMCKEMIN
ncbi:hypothetical protein EHQ81_19450 [Leptospira selangorensis]|uniref:Uncharacterized protein n=1 Tax=Leptospira selangorensis TaxID=2484982 RepID=A0A5F2C6G9_9LEPT|nr:hypothetical protein [Leptospira selangorensis]TGM10283.1 hypothetical protein EHQ81_19450 [Leptospira selangorensis]TGM27945.1 hypothetical protein EHQ82_01630 [Leptospira selangorensis]